MTKSIAIVARRNEAAKNLDRIYREIANAVTSVNGAVASITSQLALLRSAAMDDSEAFDQADIADIDAASVHFRAEIQRVAAELTGD